MNFKNRIAVCALVCLCAHAFAPGNESQVAVTFSGGHDTNPVDHGRPVVLVAAGLGVAPEVFRDAFSHVKPAGPGQEPEPEQVRKNKQALMSMLEPLGVNNDLLDKVSNYYRYSSSKGEMWRSRAAIATATVRDGVVTGFTVTDAGAGYSTPPKISVPGIEKLEATVVLAFGTDLDKNGCIKEIKLGAAPEKKPDEHPKDAAKADGPPAPPPPPAAPPAPRDDKAAHGPRAVDEALRALPLTDEQKAKVDPVIKQFHDNMKAAMDRHHEEMKKVNDALVNSMKDVLDAKQLEQLNEAVKRAAPPPPAPPHDGPPRKD